MTSNQEIIANVRKNNTLRKRMARSKASYLMCGPYFLLFFLFTVLPVLTSIVLSFTYFNMLEAPTFIGWDNYIKLILDPLDIDHMALIRLIEFTWRKRSKHVGKRRFNNVKIVGISIDLGPGSTRRLTAINKKIANLKRDVFKRKIDRFITKRTI